VQSDFKIYQITNQNRTDHQNGTEEKNRRSMTQWASNTAKGILAAAVDCGGSNKLALCSIYHKRVSERFDFCAPGLIGTRRNNPKTAIYVLENRPWVFSSNMIKIRPFSRKLKKITEKSSLIWKTRPYVRKSIIASWCTYAHTEKVLCVRLYRNKIESSRSVSSSFGDKHLTTSDF
jgi:hypothetical protein